VVFVVGGWGGVGMGGQKTRGQELIRAVTIEGKIRGKRGKGTRLLFLAASCQGEVATFSLGSLRHGLRA